MPLTLKQLEERLAAVENELAALRKQLKKRAAPANGRHKRKRPKTLLELADESHDEMAAAAEESLREMGISGAPVGAEKLQQMMIDAGIDPTDNWFSREIMAMREE